MAALLEQHVRCKQRCFFRWFADRTCEWLQTRHSRLTPTLWEKLLLVLGRRCSQPCPSVSTLLMAKGSTAPAALGSLSTWRMEYLELNLTLHWSLQALWKHWFEPAELKLEPGIGFSVACGAVVRFGFSLLHLIKSNWRYKNLLSKYYFSMGAMLL